MGKTAAVAAAAILSFLPVSPVRAADLPLAGYPGLLLERLWAEGEVDGYWPAFLPLSRREAASLLAGVSLPPGAPPPLFPSNFTRIFLDAGKEGLVPPGSNGEEMGPPAAGGGLFLTPPAEGFSLYLEGRFPADSGRPASLDEGWMRYEGGGVRLTLGKEGLWWGPGRRGDLILSANARPLSMARVESDGPFLLPGSLGRARVSFFLSRLEEGRSIPRPLMGGLKAGWSPHPDFLLSVTRTFLWGGEGKHETPAEFLRALLAENDGSGNVIGNQVAGFDFAWRTAAGPQPFVLYGESAGEDEANALPTHLGFLAGIYLPRLGSCRLLDLRLEWATTDMPGHPSTWYQHPEYPYSYHGRVMGHPMGNAASNYSLAVGLWPSSGNRFGICSAWTDHGAAEGGGMSRLLAFRADLGAGEGLRFSGQWGREVRRGGAAEGSAGGSWFRLSCEQEI